MDVERETMTGQIETLRAAEIVRDQHAQLQGLLGAIRRTQSELAAQLLNVDRSLREIREQIGRTAGARPGQSSTDHTLEVGGLQEREQALRRQQGSLAERLANIQSDLRRLRAVAKQSQISADYLAGSIGDHDEDLVSLTQVWALEAQEEERRRLAREIHDGPAQVLVNAIFELE